MDRRPRLAIFAKAPILGQVKTRLATDLGPDAALGIYRRLLSRTLDRLDRPRWRTELWVTPDAAAAEDALWPSPLPRVPQGTGDLGARMLRALDRAASDGPAIVVGADIPDLLARHIDDALAALAEGPLVFGPARDGGFYLVGSNGPPPAGLFDDVPWSHPDTLAASLANAAPAVPSLIDRLDDLDDLTDLHRHRGQPNWDALLP